MTRYGDEISVYYSPDVGGVAYEWRASSSNQSLVGLASSVYVGLSQLPARGIATFDNVSLSTISSPPTQPSTTWLGNTFPGSGTWAIYRGSALTVDGNGYLYVQGQGEAQSLESFTASTGAFHTYFSHSHYAAAPGIASSCGYVFSPLDDQVEGLGGPGIQFYNTNGQVSSQSNPTLQDGYGIFEGSTSSNPVSYINVAADPSKCTLYGLVDGTSYVHKLDTSAVSISDTQNATVPPSEVGSPFQLAVGSGNLATRIAVEPTGNYLWAIVAAATSHHVEKFSATDGSFQNITITGLKDPEGLAVDTQGNVYVTDHDPSDQRIRVFTSAGAYLRTLGLTNGSYAESTAGTILATSLDHPEGIWVDGSNNLYVASSGPFISQAFGNTGMQLRMYKPNTTGGLVTSLGSSNLVWHNEGLEYTDGAMPDPASPTDVYDKYHHYTSVNYSNLASPTNSSFWTYKGQTLDDLHYSNADPTIGDPRISDGNYTGGGFVRHINGEKFLLIQDANGGYKLEIYKFATGSEIAVPYARFNRRTTAKNNFEIWVDGNANGILDSTNANCATTNGGSGGTVTGEETCVYPSPMGDPSQDFFTWYMDSNGNVWSVGSNNGAAPRSLSISFRAPAIQAGAMPQLRPIAVSRRGVCRRRSHTRVVRRRAYFSSASPVRYRQRCDVRNRIHQQLQRNALQLAAPDEVEVMWSF